MRILACNPDTIGDLVLRQPLYRALQAAGHELLLIVRPSALEAAALVAPEARTLLLPREVYAPLADHWNDFAQLITDAIAFQPDVLLIAPYQWTAFEEHLAAELRKALPAVRVIGMTGKLYAGDPHGGHTAVSTLVMDQAVQVEEDSPEIAKNSSLIDIFDCFSTSMPPVIKPDATSLDEARRILSDRGLEPGAFWIACVTGTAHVPIKAWPEERWAEALGEWHRGSGTRFLFVGLPQEREAVDRIRGMMGDDAATAVWMEADGSLAKLAALTSLSAGYVGHDTGPMHIAAAVGNPVLAVFGGGHGMRFAPRGAQSVAISMRVPCINCGWACSFSRSHCVKDVPVQAVLEAAADLEAGRVTTAEQRLLEPQANTLEEMVQFAGTLARERLRESADSRQAERVANQHNQQTSAENSELRARVDSIAAELALVKNQAHQTQQAMQALSEEAAGLVQQLADRETALTDLRQNVASLETLRAENAKLAAAVTEAKAAAQTAQAELETLRKQQAAASDRPTPRVRKSWRERMVDLVCGQRHYTPGSVPPPMPKICIVTPISAGCDEAVARRTIESVLHSGYPHLEYVLVGQADHPLIADYATRVKRVIPPGDQPFAGVAQAFATTDATVIACIDPVFELEPGALLRAGEYFRDHSLAMAVSFEQTIERNGWRLPADRQRLDVMALRQGGIRLADDSPVFYRQQAYSLLGAVNPARGQAAGWDLLIRFSRRFGIRQASGHAVCRLKDVSSREQSGELIPTAVERDFEAAKAAFERSFGVAGRIRCGLLALPAELRRIRGGWPTRADRKNKRWSTFPFQLPPCTPAPVTADVAPLSPVTHRPPNRLLLTSPDICTDDATTYLAYYDSPGDVAIAYPPMDGAALGALHDRRRELSEKAVIPVATEALLAAHSMRQGFASDTLNSSLYRNFTGWSRWKNRLTRLPSPYWKLSGRKAGSESDAQRLLSLVGPGVARDSSTRALVVGCFDGKVLDELKRQTPWQLFGIETNEQAMETARSRGHHVWLTSPQDAFMTIPDGQLFDLVFVPNMLEHWDDPAWVIRRLLRLMSPTGRLVVRTPNLDSALLERFGPTWWHWQLPHHRVLFGRRGLKQLAAVCDLNVESLKTVTDAYTAAASVQLNKLGLAGVVPEGAAFAPDVSAEGARLAGWARMLWDKWGRGDEMWAVLRPM